MTPEHSLELFFRACGAFGLLAACFGAAFPWSVRLAFACSFSLLVSGDGLLFSLLGERPDFAISLKNVFPEIVLGAVIVLPACLSCFVVLLFSHWAAELVLPGGGHLFFASDVTAKSRRLQSLVSALLLLGALPFLPFLPDLFLRLTESLFSVSSASMPTASAFPGRLLLASGRLALVAAMGLALPLIAVSFAFEAAVLLAGRYLAPFRGEPAFRGLRLLVVGAALAGSIYSLSQLVEAVTRDGVSQKRISATLSGATSPAQAGASKPGAPK